MSNRYKRGKIYRLVSDNTDKIYIGSTIRSLAGRISRHRSNNKLYKNNKYRFVTSFNILDAGNARIELIENYPCSSRKELFKREGYFIKLFGNICVNKIEVGRSCKEYREINKDKINQASRDYYKNVSSIKMPCECGAIITKSNLKKHKISLKHCRIMGILNEDNI